MNDSTAHRVLPKITELDIKPQILDLFRNKIAHITLGTEEHLSTGATVMDDHSVFLPLTGHGKLEDTKGLCIPSDNLSKATIVGSHLYVQDRDGRELDITFMTSNTIALDNIGMGSPELAHRANTRPELIYRIRDYVEADNELQLSRADCRELYRALDTTWTEEHLKTLSNDDSSLAHQLIMSLRINAEHDDGWSLANFERDSLYTLLIRPLFNL